MPLSPVKVSGLVDAGLSQTWRDTLLSFDKLAWNNLRFIWVVAGSNLLFRVFVLFEKFILKTKIFG